MKPTPTTHQIFLRSGDGRRVAFRFELCQLLLFAFVASIFSPAIIGCNRHEGDKSSAPIDEFDAIQEREETPIDEFDAIQEREETPIVIEPLSEVPEMPTHVVEAENTLFEVIENKVARDRESGVVNFNLRIPGLVTVSRQSYEISFHGDGETMNSLVYEIKYLQSQQGAYWADEVGIGAYDGAEILVTEIWGIVRHPIKTAQGVVEGANEAYKYFWRWWDGEQPLPTYDDVKTFAHAYYENRLAELAAENDFDFGLSHIPETREVLERQVNALISGEAIFHVTTLFVAYLKLGKLAKLEAVGSASNLFKSLGRIAKSIKKLRVDKGKALQVIEKVTEKIAKRIDPRAIQALKGNRSENRQFYRLLFQLHHARKYGATNSTIIRNSLKRVEADNPIDEILHSPSLVEKQLLQAYEDAKKWGVFDDMDNLKSLSRGAAPTIKKGKYAGQQVNVDHIVPLSREPQLGQNLGNLRLAPASENIKRGNVFDEAAEKHFEVFQKQFPKLKQTPIGIAA